MYGTDYSKANTTYADGHGVFHAIVTATDDATADKKAARNLIKAEYKARNYYWARKHDVRFVETTEDGTCVYVEAFNATN